METDTNILLVLDSSNLLARSFFAASAGKEGQNVTGLARKTLAQMLRTLLRETGDPLRRVAAFDPGGQTFRHRLYPAYKSSRGPKPEGYAEFAALVPGILAEHGFELYVSDDHEADDAIAAIADQALPSGWRTTICSNDGDLLQLVVGNGPGPGTFVLKYDKGAYSSIGARQVVAKLGVLPHRVAIFKALAGDAGDFYPGVAGLGPVAAKRLALKYGSPKALWAALPELQKSDRAALELAGFAHLELMHTLARLNHRATLRTLEVS